MLISPSSSVQREVTLGRKDKVLADKCLGKDFYQTRSNPCIKKANIVTNKGRLVMPLDADSLPGCYS